MKIFKKMDLVIIIGLVVLSFTPHLMFAKSLSKDNSSIYASIKINGKYYDNIDLTNDKEELELKTSTGYNTLLLENNTIKMIHADCNDSLCVKQGVISRPGQTIICLPNELIIEIKGEKSDSSSDMILSH